MHMSGFTTRIAALRLYHSRLNVRDRYYECDRGIIKISGLWSEAAQFLYKTVGCYSHKTRFDPPAVFRLCEGSAMVSALNLQCPNKYYVLP